MKIVLIYFITIFLLACSSSSTDTTESTDSENNTTSETGTTGNNNTGGGSNGSITPSNEDEQPTATVILRPGDHIEGTNNTIINAIPIAIGDDGSAILRALLSDNTTTLIRYKASDSTVELILQSSSSDPLTFNLNKLFKNVELARSIDDAAFITFEVTVEGLNLIPSITETGLYYWTPASGVKPVLRKNEVCAGEPNNNSPVELSDKKDMNAFGVFLFKTYCAPEFEFIYAIGQPQAWDTLNFNDQPIDGFSGFTPAKITSMEINSINNNGLMLGIPLIYCGTSPDCTYEKSNPIYLVNRHGIVGDISTTMEYQLDGVTRPLVIPSFINLDDKNNVIFFSGLLPNSPYQFGDIATNNGIFSIENKVKDDIIRFDLSDFYLKSIPEYPGESMSIPTLLLQNDPISDEGDGYFRVDIRHDSTGKQREAIFTLRDTELNAFIATGDHAPGIDGSTIEQITSIVMTPNGRLAFNASVAGKPITYVEMPCHDTKLFPVDSQFIQRYVPDANPSTPLDLYGSNVQVFNQQGDLISLVHGETIIFNFPPGKCDIDIVVNSSGDAEDNNHGDGQCNTGGSVANKAECTLRAAIQEVNALSDINVIELDFSSSNSDVSIYPNSPLPIITDQIVIRKSDTTTVNIRLIGSQAGNTHGIQNSAGNLSLDGLDIMQFAQDGIHALAAGSVNLSHMNILDNGGYGVNANGALNIKGKKTQQFLIQGNSRAGIIANSRIHLENVDILENLEAGIVAEDLAILIATRINNNGAEGFVSNNGGSCSKLKLSLQPPMFEGSLVAYSEFSGNSSNGIFIEAGSVNLAPGTKIESNSSTGVSVQCGKLSVGNINHPNEEMVRVTDNGNGTHCFVSGDINSNYLPALEPCHLGGIELLSMSDTLINVLDDIEVSSNQGFGILNAAPLKLHNVLIKENKGPGIWSPNALDSTLENLPFIVSISGFNTQITANKAEGVRIDLGHLYISGSTNISDNYANGISLTQGNLVTEGSATIDTALNARSIKNNGFGTTCLNPSFDSSSELATLTATPSTCSQHGIELLDGRLSSDLLTVINNNDRGVKTSADASFKLGQICNNSVDFDVAGILTLNLVNQVCP